MPYICKRHPCTALNCMTKTQLIYNGEYRCFDHNPDKQKERVQKNCLYFKTETGREIINRLNRERYHRLKQACVDVNVQELLNYPYVANPTQSELQKPILEEVANFEKTTIMVRSQ